MKSIPNPETGANQDWANYLYFQDNLPAVVEEWWMHNASAYWFIVKRLQNAITKQEKSLPYPPSEQGKV